MQVKLIAFAVIAVLAITTASWGDTWYVKPGGTGDGSSWLSPYGNPQLAINASASGDDIWVAAGTYLPTHEFTTSVPQSKAFWIKQARKVYGGFFGNETTLDQRRPNVHLTTLSGDLDSDGWGANNAWHVVRIQSVGGGVDEVGDDTQLDGFVITNGWADGGGTYDSYGGGLIVIEAKPAIQNCVFIQNHAVVGGGGAHIDGPLTFEATIPPEPEPAPTCEPQLRACRFIANTTAGDGGGASVVDGAGTFVCCEFIGNEAEDEGGGLFIFADAGTAGVLSVGVLLNCTFANNSGDGRSAFNGNELTLRNVVMWDADGTAGHIVEDSDPAVDTDVQNSTIEGVSGSDPLYVREAGYDTTIGTIDDNLRLACGSLAINGGNNGYLPSDKYDVDDDTVTTGEFAASLQRTERVLQTTVDRGAWETRDNDCRSDVDLNDVVDMDDIIYLIVHWGPCPPDAACLGDINDCGGDGVVGINDLLQVVVDFGNACPGSEVIGAWPDIWFECETYCENLSGSAWSSCMLQCLDGQ